MTALRALRHAVKYEMYPTISLLIRSRVTAALLGFIVEKMVYSQARPTVPKNSSWMTG